MDMPDTDPLGDLAKRKVAVDDARMKKINPKGRKLDKNGNPIVTKEELAKSGKSLRDFLNEERKLKRRDGKAVERTKDIFAPLQSPAVRANPMGDAARDQAVMNDEARKRAAAAKTMRDESNARAKATSVKQQLEKDAAAKAMRDESNARARATSVKQQLEKDAAAKAPKVRYGEAVVGMKKGGSVRGDGCAVRGKTKGRLV